MKRKQLMSVLLSTVLALSACLSITGISVPAAEAEMTEIPLETEEEPSQEELSVGEEVVSDTENNSADGELITEPAETETVQTEPANDAVAQWSVHAADTEPGDWCELRVTPGSPADLVVVAENAEGVDLHYEWSCIDPASSSEDFVPIEGAAESTLHIDEAARSLEYQCMVTDDYENGVAVGFLLKIDTGLLAYPATITPENTEDREMSDQLTVPAGSEQVLSVIAEINDGYPLYYQWYYTDFDAEELVPIEGANSNEYFVENVSAHTNPDGTQAQYICKVTDDYGNCYSPWYNLSITGTGGQGGEEPGGEEPGGDEPGGDEPGGDEPGGDEPGGDETHERTFKAWLAGYEENMEAESQNNVLEDIASKKIGETVTLEICTEAGEGDELSFEWYRELNGVEGQELIEGADSNVLEAQIYQTEWNFFTCKIRDQYGNEVEILNQIYGEEEGSGGDVPGGDEPGGDEPGGDEAHERTFMAWLNGYEENKDSSWQNNVLDDIGWKKIGETVTLEICTEAGEGDELSFQWYRELNGVEGQELIEGADSNVLEAQIYQTELNLFTCKIRDQYGNEVEILNQIYGEENYFQDAQEISPANPGAGTLTAEKGYASFAFTPERDGYYTFHTESEGLDTWAKLYDSEYQELLAAGGESEDDVSFTASLSAGQTYFILIDEGQNREGNFTIFVERQTFVVEGAGEVQNIESYTGDEVTMTVNAESDSELTYSWYEGIEDYGHELIPINGENGSSLTRKLFYGDMTFFSCKVSDGTNEAWRFFYIEVHVLRAWLNGHEESRNQTWQSINLFVRPGSDKTIHVNTEYDGQEKVCYKWYDVEQGHWEGHYETIEDGYDEWIDDGDGEGHYEWVDQSYEEWVDDEWIDGQITEIPGAVTADYTVSSVDQEKTVRCEVYTEYTDTDSGDSWSTNTLILDITLYPSDDAVEKTAQTLQAQNLTLIAGETASVSVSGAYGKLHFTSSDPSVAAVDEATGKVTAVKAGTATITIRAEETDAYEAGVTTASVKVKENNLSKGEATLSGTSYTFDGKAKTPGATVKLNGETLKAGTDYSVSYSNNTNAGTATATITGTGDYTGTVTKTFTISAAKLADSGVTVASGTYTYNGKAQTPVVTVKSGSATLKKDTDYTLAYSSNTNAGTAKATVTGKGNYTGTVAKTFTISKAKLADSGVTVASGTYTYNGKAQTPAVTVKSGSTTLKKDTDYTLAYSSNTNAGTAKATVTGKGNYTGSVAKTFTIAKAAQSITAKAGASSIAVGKTTTVSITGAQGTKSYKSSDTAIAAVTSAGKVTAKKVGTVKITATSAATANYKSASKTVTIKVLPAATTKLTAANQATGIKLTWAKVAGANGYIVYRGSTKIKTITSGSTVTYTDTKANTNGTKYTFKVVAKASTGTSTLSKSLTTYRVARPAISSVTNTAAAKATVKWGKNAKANGYQIQYGLKKDFSGAKSVNITKAATVSKVLGSLTKGKTYYVRIRTYKTVGSTKYYSLWSAAKTVKITK